MIVTAVHGHIKVLNKKFSKTNMRESVVLYAIRMCLLEFIDAAKVTPKGLVRILYYKNNIQNIWVTKYFCLYYPWKSVIYSSACWTVMFKKNIHNKIQENAECAKLYTKGYT